MDTLHELRKVGGFTDLESRIPERRSHPALLLEIIETMILAKTDPQNPLLQKRLDKGHNQILENSLKLLGINHELEDEIARVLRLMKSVKQLYMGLNFILARSGRLRTVRVDSSTSPSPWTHHAHEHMSISNRLDAYREYVNNLMSQVSALLEMICPEESEPPSDNMPALPEPLIINFKDPVRTETTDSSLDRYLQRAIRAARIAQGVENYLSDLLDIVKKLHGNLELAYAQCAVLISSRAMIAK